MALSLLLTAWVRAENTPDPVRIGVCLSLSGENSEKGKAYLRALALWTRETNARGGIMGRKVEIVAEDDKSDSSLLQAGYASLASGKADMVLGPQEYDSALDAATRASQDRLPCLLPLPAPNTIWERPGNSCVGLLCPLSDWPAGFFELVSKSGTEQVALLAVNHPYARTVLTNATKWARRYGLNPVYTAECGGDSLPAALAAAKLSGAKALAVWTCRNSASKAVKAVTEAKLSAWPVYFSSSMGPETSLGREPDNFYTAVPWDVLSAKAYPGGEHFVEEFRKAYGSDPDWVAASVYAACQVLEAACVRAGSLDRDKVRAALSGLDTLTIVGRFGVDPSGMQLRQTPLTVQWRKGRREIVWPESMRTARPFIPRDGS